MTEDMPTVDGARAEAQREWGVTCGNRTRQARIDAFVAGAEWLAPTVAALEAEVARLRIDRTADEQTNARLREIVDEQRARADAAEAVIERVRGALVGYDEHDDASPDAYDVVRRVTAALSDAAPQAVAAPEVVETAPKCGKPVGDRPSWMSPAQWAVDACDCIRVRGHEGECRCEHTDATDGREGA